MDDVNTQQAVKFVIPAERGGLKTHFRFHDDREMSLLVSVLQKNGWKFGAAVTLPQHELATAVEVLRVRPGDIVAVHHPAGLDGAAMRDLQRFAKSLVEGAAAENVVLLPEGTSLQALTDEQLAGLGLQRIKKTAPRMFFVPEEAGEEVALPEGWGHDIWGGDIVAVPRPPHAYTFDGILSSMHKTPVEPPPIYKTGQRVSFYDPRAGTPQGKDLKFGVVQGQLLDGCYCVLPDGEQFPLTVSARDVFYTTVATPHDAAVPPIDRVADEPPQDSWRDRPPLL